MVYVVISLVALLLLGVVAALTHDRHSDDPVVVADGCATCDGDNDRCEQECMLEAAVRDIEYYDDEELDAFAGRSSDAYTDEEADQFREILMTLLPSDIKGWNRSLILRGIHVPDQIKDELILLLDGQ